MTAAYISQFRCFLMALGSRLPAAGTEAAARLRIDGAWHLAIHRNPVMGFLIVRISHRDCR